jgi:hypothetical protein
MRNRFPGPCKDCGERVEAGAGYFEKAPGNGWRVRHVHCTAVAKQASGKPLSKAQRAAINEDLHEEAMEMAFPFGFEADIGGW